MSQQLSPVLEPVRDVPARGRRSVPAQWIVAGVMLGLAFLPLLYAHGQFLWIQPHYQFFPLVLAGAAALAWPVLKGGIETRPGPTARAASYALVGLSWLLLAAAVVLDVPRFAGIGGLLLLAAAPLGLGGWPLLRALLPALVYLLLVIPPPFGLDRLLITKLQLLTAKASSRVLDYFGVYHNMDGTVVETAGKRYMVEEACSGIHSLFSILACTLFYVFWARVHWLRSVCLLVAAVFWVMVQNVTRVVLIAFVGFQWGWDLSKDWPHYALDFLLFGISLLLLFSTDRFLRFLGESFSWSDETRAAQAKAAGRPAGGYPAAPPGPAPAPARWLPAWSLAAAFGVLALPQLADLALGLTSFASATKAYASSSLIRHYNEFTAETLPADIEGWKRLSKEFSFEARDSGNTFGEYSRVWRYQKGGLGAVLSFDFPFPLWHDLRDCYGFTGWTIREQRTFEHPLAEGDTPLYCLQVQFSRPYNRRGYLWFTEFDQAGTPVEQSVTDMHWKPRLEAIRASWLYLLGRADRPAPKHSAVLQVQVFADRYEELNPAQQEDLEKLFIRGAELIRGRCLVPLGGR